MNFGKDYSAAKYKNLFFLLNRRGITQSALAKGVGIAETYIRRWKNEKKGFSVKTLVKLADFLNVSVDFLLDRTDDERQINFLKAETVKKLTEISAGAELFADEAVERYGAKNRDAILCVSLKAGIAEIIEDMQN